jgi:hypothetical protein
MLIVFSRSNGFPKSTEAVETALYLLVNAPG